MIYTYICWQQKYVQGTKNHLIGRESPHFLQLGNKLSKIKQKKKNKCGTDKNYDIQIQVMVYNK